MEISCPVGGTSSPGENSANDGCGTLPIRANDSNCGKDVVRPMYPETSKLPKENKAVLKPVVTASNSKSWEISPLFSIWNFQPGSRIPTDNFPPTHNNSVPGSYRQSTILYNYLTKFVLSNSDLYQNTFPLEHPTDRGMVVITEYFPKETTCLRCGLVFITSRGRQVEPSSCRCHDGRAVKLAHGYSCCGRDEKCQVYPHHDFGNMVKVRFQKTTPSVNHSKPLRCYALDTEMCETVNGLEVTKISVVDEGCNTVYDTYVKPSSPIVDYKTQYSGVTANHLQDCNITLEGVQAVLLMLFDAQTILIGHGLDNDLKKLKLIHLNIVDTSVLFPHVRGFPYKRSLRSIVSEFLGTSIRDKCHDSVEHAAACMHIVQEMFRRSWISHY